jgi:hypothetical protein
MMPKYIIFFAMAIGLPMASAADFQKTWDNAADRRITIVTLHGDIKLSGYDGKSIDISAVKKGSDHERVVIEDASVGNHIHIFSRYLNPAQSNAAVDFEIRVPKEIFYNVEPPPKPQFGRSGPMYFQRFQMPPDASVPPKLPPDASASPKLPPDASASPKPHPLPGLYVISKPALPDAIYLKTNSGQIAISDVAGSIRAEGRNIEIQNVEGMLYASSGSGDIRVTMKQTSRRSVLRLSSSSGSISLQAPDDVGAQVHIQSTTGQVKTDFPLETVERRYGGKFIQGRLGDGNQILDIRSVSGAITFSKKPPEIKDKQAWHSGSAE